MVELSNPKYTYTKRGVFYFSKKIPTDLRHHYKKPIITQSLRTKSKMAAEKASKLLQTHHALALALTFASMGSIVD